MGGWRVFEGLLEEWQMPRLTPAQPCIHPLDTTQRQKPEPNVTYVRPCLEFRGQVIFFPLFFPKRQPVLEFSPIATWITALIKRPKQLAAVQLQDSTCWRHNKRPWRFPLMGHLLCFQALDTSAHFALPQIWDAPN